MKNLLNSILLSLTMLIAAHANATLLFDNAAVDLASANGHGNFITEPNWGARENVTLGSDALLTEIQAEFSLTIDPGLETLFVSVGIAPDDDSIFSASYNGGDIATLVKTTSRNIYTFVFAGLSVALDAGMEYWFNFSGSTSLATIRDVNSIQGDGAYSHRGGFTLPYDVAFRLYSNTTAVPEPATASLLGLALAGLTFRSRKTAT